MRGYEGVHAMPHCVSAGADPNAQVSHRLRLVLGGPVRSLPLAITSGAATHSCGPAAL
jgi:hypothetical protein